MVNSLVADEKLLLQGQEFQAGGTRRIKPSLGSLLGVVVST